MRSLCVMLPIALLVATPTSANAVNVVVASDSAAIESGWLAEVPVPDATTALALTADGQVLAFAQPAESKTGFSEITRVARPGHTGGTGVSSTTVALAGHVRDLLFLDSGELIGLQHRPAKKRVGETFLFRIGQGDSKVERVMRVPPSSADLDRWPGGGAILLACRNEIRTLLLPNYRSGPLFSVPGYNFAVTSLGHSSFVLVGQAEELLLIDLSAPSGRESMPVLLQRRVPAPVDALADYPSGSAALVRLEDGRLFRASFDPAGFQPLGSADHIAGLAKASAGPAFAFAPAVAEPADPEQAAPVAPTIAEPKVPAAEPVVVAESPEPAPEEPPRVPAKEGDPPVAKARTRLDEAPAAVSPVPPIEEAATEVEPQTHAQEAVPETAEPVELPPPTKPQTDLVEAASEPVLPAEPVVPLGEGSEAVQPDHPDATPGAPAYQLAGRIRGETGLVRDVVLLGPDNILNEAARVRLDARGRWGVDGLRAGRYRILLDGGGDRVLVAEPRFLVIDIGEKPVEAPEITVLRAF